MLYQLLRATAAIALRWYYAEIVVQGADHAPRNGPLLIVANHPNALIDPLLVGTTLSRRVLLTAKATLFDHAALAVLLRAVGVVALRRANLQMLRRLEEPQWQAGGRGDDKPITVRALAYVMAGHVRHHLAILRDRYGVA